jgi:hypothetical protein
MYSDWSEFILRDLLRGKARMVADRCFVLNETSSSIRLGMSALYQPLLDDEVVKSLNKEFQENINPDCKVSVEIAEQPDFLPTPIQERMMSRQ